MNPNRQAFRLCERSWLGEIARYARYFSFHAFLLDEYRARKMPADSARLSAFIRRREWDLGLAVLRCPNGCGRRPVGSQRLGELAQSVPFRQLSGPFPRGESVWSPLGGYGLY